MTGSRPPAPNPKSLDPHIRKHKFASKIAHPESATRILEKAVEHVMGHTQTGAHDLVEAHRHVPVWRTNLRSITDELIERWRYISHRVFEQARNDPKIHYRDWREVSAVQSMATQNLNLLQGMPTEIRETIDPIRHKLPEMLANMLEGLRIARLEPAPSVEKNANLT